MVLSKLLLAALMFVVQSNSDQVQLEWDPNPPGDNVAGYNMYRSLQPGTGYVRLNSALIPGTTYIDDTVQIGETYYYVCTAVNGDDLESGFSNEVSYSPSPPAVCLGDANQDGARDIFDILAIQRHIVNLELLTGDGLTAADANEDGAVDVFDILRIQNHIVNNNPLPDCN